MAVIAHHSKHRLSEQAILGCPKARHRDSAHPWVKGIRLPLPIAVPTKKSWVSSLGAGRERWDPVPSRAACALLRHQAPLLSGCARVAMATA